MTRLLIAVFALLAVPIALVAWATYDYRPFEDWEDMYGD